jgi:hypothetical protein
MQTRLKEEIDADLTEDYGNISDYKTAQNQFEINCSVCFKTFFTDKQTYESISRAVEQGLDNPFLCFECQQEYEESAVEDR